MWEFFSNFVAFLECMNFNDRGLPFKYTLLEITLLRFEGSHAAASAEASEAIVRLQLCWL